jgi:ABC-type multidrug transport system fused ATPase/permease subunit
VNKGDPDATYIQRLKEIARVLPDKDLKKISLVIVLQIFMGLIDLLGVALIGVLGALAVSGVQSTAPGSKVEMLLRLLNLDGLVFQTQAAILGTAAAVILISRTLISVIFTRRTLFFLSRRGAILTTNLVSKLLSEPLIRIQQNTSQDLVFALTTGVNAITLGILGTGVILISDMSLLLVMGIGLFAVDPVIAFISATSFSGIAILIYKMMHGRAENLGKEESAVSIKSNEMIIEVLASYRESVVRNRRDYYVREISSLRWRNSTVLAELAFMPNISKYVIESTVVLGALAISAAQFIMQDAAQAIATLAVFLAAGTRIAPAILRVQQGALQIKSSFGAATPTLNLINLLKHSNPLPEVADSIEIMHQGFVPKIEITNVCLRYPGKTEYALKNVSINITPGSTVAIVGPSGGGKTSLVDVILGVIKPTSGEVMISHHEPLDAISIWPGAIGYVPQDVILVSGTIRQNVALGFPESEATDEMVSKSLELAKISEFINSQAQGIDVQVGERGAKLSGGQRQRIGVARALFTNPKLLVLDEATSALDGETEAGITDSIQNLRGTTTVIMIAHRLSTIRDVDQVIYMEKGKVVCTGKFEEVRKLVPNFDSQANLMGL